MNSHLLLLFISYKSSGEKLIKYQADSSCVIMSTLFYKALTVQREIWCWSLLGLKGLIHFLNNWGQVREFHFCKEVVPKNNHFVMPLPSVPQFRIAPFPQYLLGESNKVCRKQT